MKLYWCDNCGLMSNDSSAIILQPDGETDWCKDCQEIKLKLNGK